MPTSGLVLLLIIVVIAVAAIIVPPVLLSRRIKGVEQSVRELSGKLESPQSPR